MQLTAVLLLMLPVLEVLLRRLAAVFLGAVDVVVVVELESFFSNLPSRSL